MSRIESNSVQLGDSYTLGSNSKRQAEAENAELERSRAQIQSLIVSAQAEAERIISEAHLQAQEILQSAQANGYESGMKSGYEAGYSDAFNQLMSECSSKVKNLDNLAEYGNEIKKELIQSAEKDIIELVIMISEKLVRGKLEINPEIIGNIVKSAISELKEKDTVKVLVHPSFSQGLCKISEHIKQEINGLNNIKIIEDKTVSPDGAIVESLETRIDARLSSQIAELTRVLLGEAAKTPDNETSQEITKTKKTKNK